MPRSAKLLEVPQDEPLPRRVATGLARIGVALKARAWREAGERGLTPTQGQILGLLLADPDRRKRLQPLADALGVSAATASEAVRALERKRLVEKARSAEDGRALAVALTPRGRAEASRVASWPEFLIEGVSLLPLPEQEALLRLLVRLIRGLQERGQIPVSAMCLTCRFFRPNVHESSRRPHHCGFVDAPFGDAALRLDCPDHHAACADQASSAFRIWSRSSPPRSAAPSVGPS